LWASDHLTYERYAMLAFVVDPRIKAALLFAVVLLLVAVGLYVARILRGGDGHDQLTSSEMLTKFGEMHGQGNLSEEEFRTIKTKLTPHIKAELRDNDETG